LWILVFGCWSSDLGCSSRLTSRHGLPRNWDLRIRRSLLFCRRLRALGWKEDCVLSSWGQAGWPTAITNTGSKLATVSAWAWESWCGLRELWSTVWVHCTGLLSSPPMSDRTDSTCYQRANPIIICFRISWPWCRSGSGCWRRGLGPKFRIPLLYTFKLIKW
jgi:hypothetical protein